MSSKLRSSLVNQLPIKTFSEQQQLATSYFLYFLTLGLYGPYFPSYLRLHGIEGIRLGWVLAVLPMMRAVLPPLLGFVADRRRGPRFWNIVVAWGAVLALGVLICLSRTASSWLLVGIVCYYIFTAPTNALLDASTVQLLRRTGSSNSSSSGGFGRVRLWGSAGFILSSFGLGLLYPQLPAAAIITSLMCAHIIFAVFISLPRWNANDPPAEQPTEHPSWRDLPGLVGNANVWLVLSTLFLNRLAGTPFYGFYTIFVQDSGLGGDVVALTWGLAVSTEIAAMLAVDRFIDRLGYRNVLAGGVFLEAVRWFAYAAVDSELGLLLLAPAHGVAFAMLYVAGVRALTENIPQNLSSVGQGVGAAASAAGQVIGYVAAGYLQQNVGNKRMFLAAGCIGMIATANALLVGRLNHRQTF